MHYSQHFFLLLFQRALIRSPNILDQSILKHISLMTMFHADDLPSFRAHQKSCFCSRSFASGYKRGTTHGIAEWTPRAYFSAFAGHFSYLLGADYNFHVARICERVDMQNFIFFPPLLRGILVLATNSLYEVLALFKPRW